MSFPDTEAVATGAGQAHLLVVDDDQRLRLLIARFLAENGFRVTTAASAEDARAKMAGIDFDLVVLDVMMPGESGFELATWVRRDSHVPILMLTAMDEVEQRIAGLEHGADDYLAKPFEPRELLLRLRGILRRAGRPEVKPSGVAFGEFYFDIERRELRRAGALVHLTSAESALLGVFARQPGVVLSRDRLRAQSGGGARTIDVQITRLRRKIEADPRAPRYLCTAWGEGYLLLAD